MRFEHSALAVPVPPPIDIQRFTDVASLSSGINSRKLQSGPPYN